MNDDMLDLLYKMRSELKESEIEESVIDRLKANDYWIDSSTATENIIAFVRSFLLCDELYKYVDDYWDEDSFLDLEDVNLNKMI